MGGIPEHPRSGFPPPLTPPHILVARLRRDGEGNPVVAVVGGSFHLLRVTEKAVADYAATCSSAASRWGRNAG